MSPARPTTHVDDPLTRIGAAALACLLVGALAAASVIALFFLAYTGSGEGTSGVDGQAIFLFAIAAAVAVGLCVAVAWLGRVALTGNATRPTWRLWLGAPAVYLLLVASLFVRP